MLDLAPRNSAMTSSQRGSFLNKAESIKKLRGLDADIDLEEFEKKAQEKVKKSMAKIVSSMVSQDFHDDLDVEVRIPSVARGKSSELINNATFLRQYIGKESDDAEKPFSAVPLKQTKSVTVGETMNQRKEVLSRKDFFRDIDIKRKVANKLINHTIFFKCASDIDNTVRKLRASSFGVDLSDYLTIANHKQTKSIKQHINNSIQKSVESSMEDQPKPISPKKALKDCQKILHLIRHGIYWPLSDLVSKTSFPFICYMVVFYLIDKGYADTIRQEDMLMIKLKLT